MPVIPESVLKGQLIHLKHCYKISFALIRLGSNYVELGRCVRGYQYEVQHDAKQFGELLWFYLGSQACQDGDQPLGRKVLDKSCLN